jgi:hypothetical protein
MDHKCITSHFKLLESAAITLSILERMQLELALTQLGDQLKFEALHFWGKITGMLLVLKKFITFV